MFETLGGFSAVYFTLAGILFILVLFEKYFIAFEDKTRARKKQRKVKANEQLITDSRKRTNK